MTEQRPFSGDGFEAAGQPPAPEVACMQALMALKEVQPYRRPHPVHDFYATCTEAQPPADLFTAIEVRAGTERDPAIHVPGTDVVMALIVDFDSKDSSAHTMLNLDVVNTPEDGLLICRKEWFIIGGQRLPRYTGALDEEQVRALQKDAEAIRQMTIESDMERMKLGPLVEEAREDGTRRFHIGDIMAVLTGRLVSVRGMEGISDILGYMTDDDPYTTQIGRFVQECAPHLRQQAEALLPYCEQLEQRQGSFSEIDLYKMLTEISEALGTSFLEVTPIDPSQHTTLDPITEMELDYGPEIRDKIIQIDLDPNRDEES